MQTSLTLQQMAESTQRYVIYLFILFLTIFKSRPVYILGVASKQKLSKLAHVMTLLTCVQKIPGMGLRCDTNSADFHVVFFNLSRKRTLN